MKYYLTIILLIFSQSIIAQTNPSEFVVKPYLQLGKKTSPRSIQLLWHAPVSNNDVWLAEYKNSGETDWRKSEGLIFSTVAVGSIAPFNVYSTSFTSLNPGTVFQYRLSKNGQVIFSSEGKALKLPEQSYRIAISGDMGAGNNTARKIAYEIYKAKQMMEWRKMRSQGQNI